MAAGRVLSYLWRGRGTGCAISQWNVLCAPGQACPSQGVFASAACSYDRGESVFSSLRPWSSKASLHTSVSGRGFVQSWEEISDDPIDPFAVVRDEVMAVSERLRHSISSHVPVLAKAAEYFFRRGVEGKRLRPTLVLLLSSALSKDVPSKEFLQIDIRPPHEHPAELRRKQQRIAEITELIHVASLLHDDVIDDAETRRGILSLNATAGNKLAILAGDFLLARASVSLSSLQNTEIVELLSRVLEHLVTGEVMQLSATPDQLVDLEHYMQKSFYKTASLMANSARAVAILADQSAEVCDLAWGFGRHLGLAFQVVDDVLDMTGSSTVLGKPALNDLRSGIATAPVLYAAREQTALGPLVMRKFKHDGDVKQAIALVERTTGVLQAQQLAAHHAALAAQMVNSLPPAASAHASICRQALLTLTERVLMRNK